MVAISVKTNIDKARRELRSAKSLWQNQNNLSEIKKLLTESSQK